MLLPSAVPWAVSDHVHDALAVDGVAQGLTHLLVVKGGHSVVQIHRLYQIQLPSRIWKSLSS